MTRRTTGRTDAHGLRDLAQRRRRPIRQFGIRGSRVAFGAAGFVGAQRAVDLGVSTRGTNPAFDAQWARRHGCETAEGASS
jgi:hypothetical protein